MNGVAPVALTVQWAWPDDPEEVVANYETIKAIRRAAEAEVGIVRLASDENPVTFVDDWYDERWALLPRAYVLAFDAVGITYEMVSLNAYAERRVALEPDGPTRGYGLPFNLKWWDIFQTRELRSR